MMSIEGGGSYTPDYWVVVKVFREDGSPYYRLVCSWSGGYLDGDSWQINSGIVEMEDVGEHYIVHGKSGSRYQVYKDSYGLRDSMMPIVDTLCDYFRAYSDELVLEDREDWTLFFTDPQLELPL